VELDIEGRLGQVKARSFRRARGSALKSVERGARVSVVPELPDCEFDPPTSSFLRVKDWNCSAFRFRVLPSAARLKPTATRTGSVSFYFESILVGAVAVQVTLDGPGAPSDLPESTNVLGVDPYRSVFVSYSHEDSTIVDQLERAYAVLGLEYLRDVRRLRSGERWSPALLRMIDNAEVFQLCWSAAASRSDFVGREWRYALSFNRPSFIRPMYWELPMPLPPVELASMHFAYLELGWLGRVKVAIRRYWQRLVAR
jgi:TIR domain-containing protein